MGTERIGGRGVGKVRRGTGLGFWLRGCPGGLAEGFWRGRAADWVSEREGAVSTAGELGVEGEVADDVGEGDGDGRGRFRGSFTLPNKGGGTPGVPGRWRGSAWQRTKGSFTVPGRGSLGGSPSNDDMRGGGATLPPLGPTPPLSAASGLTE